MGVGGGRRCLRVGRRLGRVRRGPVDGPRLIVVAGIGVKSGVLVDSAATVVDHGRVPDGRPYTVGRTIRGRPETVNGVVRNHDVVVARVLHPGQVDPRSAHRGRRKRRDGRHIQGAAADHDRVPLKVVRQAAVVVDLHGVRTRRGRSDVHLLHVVDVVFARGRGDRRACPVQDIRAVSRAAPRPLHDEVQVIDQDRRRTVMVRRRRPRRIGPAQRHADRIRPVPGEHVVVACIGDGELPLDKPGVRVGFLVVGLDELRGGQGIHQAPAIGVVRAGVAEVIGRVQYESFQRTGPHGPTRKEIAVVVYQ